MNLRKPNAECFVPDGLAPEGALARVTHLGIGAHQDDLEFMALHGILACFHHPEGRWFGGVTCTDGAGSARAGGYRECTDAGMREIRRAEQRAAAVLGHYAAMLQLDYASAEIRGPGCGGLVDDLEAVLRAARPETVYTHNLADKHDTHIAVAAAVVAAARRLPADARPSALYGCEVWRGLDWMNDAEKTVLDVSGHDHLAAALAGVFDSQIAGGKRYDLATAGRRAANATFFESHVTDRVSQAIFAMDLTPLLRDPSLDPVAYALGFIDRFRDDVAARLRARFGAND